jgi:anti-sigma factor RsiW
MKNNCAGMDAKLADLLLDAATVPVEVQSHLEGCERCRRELNELRATMTLMESWEAPEPGPYFLTRLAARMREERAAEPSGWFNLLRARLVYGTGTHVRPLAAMALSVVLLVGGGAYLGMTDWEQPQTAPRQAAVVKDLQTMDSNAQLLDELESLSSNN